MPAALAAAACVGLPPCAAQPPPSDTALLAATCATCHGPGGRPPAGGASIPALRGQHAARLLRRLQALQEHRDPSATVMPQLLQGLDEAQLRALAQWFSRPEPR